jgi:hypothetical protein
MMARATINEHPDLPRIQYDLARGTPVRVVARKYNVNMHACYRLLRRMPPQLKAAHIGQRLKAAADLERLRIDESEGLLVNLSTQRARLLLCQDSALDAGDTAKVAYIANVIHRNLEIVGRYLGEFAQHQIHTNINILVSAEYLEFRAALMQALAPFPEARRAVAVALHAIEAKAADPATAKVQTALPAPIIEHEASHVAA